MYLKIFKENDKHNGFQYKDGLNVDKIPFNNDLTKSCCSGGFYFSDEKDICRFLVYGDFIREVIPKSKVIKDPDGNKYRTHELYLNPKKDLSLVSTWKWMIENNVDVTADNSAIQYAAEKGYLEVVEFLVEQGADVTAGNNSVIQLASENGHLKVVKCLVEKGADVTAANNYAIQLASKYDHLKVVKYLIKNGADISVLSIWQRIKLFFIKDK